jgi:ParB family chromosome partitioning protein
LKSEDGKIRIRDMTYERLSLAGINLEDDRFRTSYFPDLSRLILSIKKVGLISPPLVRPGKKGYVLVTGWKRVLACRKLRLAEISVLVTEEEDDLQVFLRGFYDNLAAREIPFLEKAEIACKLRSFGVDRTELLKVYLPLLSLPATVAHLEALLGLAEADAALKKFVREKEVPLPVVQALLRFSPAGRKPLFPLLRPLGQNKQREILGNSWEICRRDNVSVRDILSDDEARRALVSKKLSPLQKAERIRGFLRRKRFPHLSFREKEFNSALRKIRCPPGLAIRPSPCFEDERISASFWFKDEREFRAGVKRLGEIAGNKDLAGLFKR